MLEHTIENIRFDSPAEPLEHAIPFAKFNRQLPPLRPGPDDPHDRFQVQAWIPPSLPRITGFAEAVRFDDRQLRIGQYSSSQGCSPLSATLNQKSGDFGVSNVNNR